MKSLIPFILAIFLPGFHGLAQDSVFTGKGDWLEEDRWDAGLPSDGSLAAVNGICEISEDIVEQNTQNPVGVIIGMGVDGQLTVSGGTLSGAQGGGSGIFVGQGPGGVGTLIIKEGAAYRSQGGDMNVRIGDESGGRGTVIVEGELLNFKFFEILNGVLEMGPTGINSKFNQLDTRCRITNQGTLSYRIDGEKVGTLARSNTSGLNLDLEAGANLKIELGGNFSVGQSWVLMSYTSLTGEFAQGTGFVNEQGYAFEIDYGNRSEGGEAILTLASLDSRPQIESFSATPASIASGESTTLSWKIDKGAVSIDHGGGNSVALEGDLEVSPAETTTYTLTVDFEGVLATAQVTVVVDAVPEIQLFEAAPELVAPGGEAILKWRVAGGDSVRLDGEAVEAIGQFVVVPKETGTYQLSATNRNGTTNKEISVVVNALEAALTNLYEADNPVQTNGALIDPLNFVNFDIKNGEVADAESEQTTINRAYRMIEFGNRTGGDNGNGYAGRNITYEVWVKLGEFLNDPEHQVIFETGGGENGCSILATPDSIRFINSSGGERTVDIEVSYLQINFEDDFLQITASLDDDAGLALLSVKGAGGGSAVATGAGMLGVPEGRATLFSHNTFASSVADTLGGVGAEEPELVTHFRGGVSVVKIYDRALSEEEINQAFKKIAVAGDDDSDNDGLLDFWEVRFFGNTNARANGDEDGDGLNNLGEFQNGSFPDLEDSDGDGLNDGDEVNTFGSSPIDLDSDKDGLTDAREVNELNTAPGKPDTDGDGFRDDVELALETDPTEAGSAPPATSILLVRPPTGDETWNSAEIWSDGLAPSVDKDYFVVGSLSRILQTPNGGGAFNGRSLILAGDALLDLRHSGSVEIAQLVIRDDATVRQSAEANAVQGNLELDGHLEIEHLVDGGRLDLAVTLNGTGSVRVFFNDEELSVPETWLTGKGSDLQADWIIEGGTLKAVALGSLGTGDLIIRRGAFDPGYNVNLPANNLSLAGADFSICLDQNLVFRSLRAISEDRVTLEYPEGDYDVSGIEAVAFDGERFKGDGIFSVVGESGDSDEDGLLDSWEAEVFGDLDETAEGDTDSDDLSNGMEFSAGSDPSRKDTDDDGLSDGDEVLVHGSRPDVVDTDEDGLNDGEEVNGQPSSDPGLADTDGDGLSDFVEVREDPKTDPTLADTDGDGFDDRFEISQNSDPNDAESLPEDRLGPAVLVVNEIGPLGSFDGILNGSDLLDASFRVRIDFESKVDGERELIFETGGGTIGTSVVYEAGNKLVMRSIGNGGFSLAQAEYVLTPAQIESGELELIWVYEVNSEGDQERIALFLDGAEVASAMEELGNDWSGSNDATFGAVSGNLSGDGQNNSLTAEAFTSGSIDEDHGLQFFAGRLFVGTGEVEPNGGTVTLVDGGVGISWISQAGTSIVVEYSTTLNSDSWTTIATVESVEGKNIFEDKDADRTVAPKGFYRARVAE